LLPFLEPDQDLAPVLIPDQLKDQDRECIDNRVRDKDIVLENNLALDQDKLKDFKGWCNKSPLINTVL